MARRGEGDALTLFHPAVRTWFTSAFAQPTPAQTAGWAPIGRGESTLILAPTGSGKTLAAFLWSLNRVLFDPPPEPTRRCRVLYISPLKALAVDVERNLREPLAGIARTAEARGDPFTMPTIAVRTGDTPASDRARFVREPADILITTPESLFLLLTSQARDALRSIDTIIVDEIHALVPTKRGAHLALAIERVAARCARPPQRIGLSATQRPLDEVARFLGGAVKADATAPNARRAVTRQSGRRTRRSQSGTSAATSAAPVAEQVAHQFADRREPLAYRPVTVVDTTHKKALRLRIEVPVEDMARLTPREQGPSASESSGAASPSIWTAIHPRVLELVRTHRSTLIFVNSRRIAERLAGALNELAGETLVRAHHGSLARPQRVEVEELLKAGRLAGLVATSSLELGIDMGAIDLVVQIEAPPSVASGLQRIGRGGHQIDAVSEGVIVPKFRGDLVACAAVAQAMHEGRVEATRYPRNPLDVLAQHLVSMTAMDEWRVDELFDVVRQAAPFAELSRTAFDGVLDMLSGRYPSDEFAELRPRITWDRLAGVVIAREGAKRVAIANSGTIPDRGLYGVFLSNATPGATSARVGELDEEMVFESHVGDTFVLGASSWRIDEITHDRVLVSPAPGEPGRMPFWKGDRAGRPLELGLAIGSLVHELGRLPHAAAMERLITRHDLDRIAAENLLQYLADERRATGVVPDAATIVVERVRDDLGDWRVCVLSPRGGRIHAPWAMAAAARIREAADIDVETLWGDDGFVVRFPDVDTPPDPRLVLPDPDEVQSLVVRQLGATALFAAKFRENAARSLLLPRRRAGLRTPLWQQRKRAYDLLAVAARFGSFPVLLETYRECLQDFFDMPALVETLADIRSRRLRVATVDLDTPSPFAASLLFSYVASFLYDGDAPLAERRAQALAVDQAQLRDLLGDAELRELLNADVIEQVERQLQRLEPKDRARHADGVHDLLLALGDLDAHEIAARTVSAEVAASIRDLVRAGRALLVRIAGVERFIAVEDAARLRDALGLSLPPGIPEPLLEAVADPLGDLARRYARTHAPFSAADFAGRYGLPVARAEQLLVRLTADGRLIEGEFRPGGVRREWTDADVLRRVRRRSLAALRREVEPVEPPAFARFVATWQGVADPAKGPDALLDAIERLQGAPLAASALESAILPARIAGFAPGDLDALMAAGEVVWVGLEAIGDSDGRIALFLARDLARLWSPRPASPGGDPKMSAREGAVMEWLRAHGASFFTALHEGLEGGYPGDTVEALWALVWRGLVSNDSMQPLRALTRGRPARRRDPRPATFRSRRLVPPTAEGRWSLVPASHPSTRTARKSGTGGSDGAARTRWLTAVCQQLLTRHGVLTREAVAAEGVPGGFGTIYPVLKAMEESGRIRRGYFVAGLGATQFASPGAVDLLRAPREQPYDTATGGAIAAPVVLDATDPANPYGATLKWPPRRTDAGRGPTRSVGATTFIVDGALTAFLVRGDRQLLTWLPDAEPERSRRARSVAEALIGRARTGDDESAGVAPRDTAGMLPAAHPRGMLIEEIDGRSPVDHPITPYLVRAGFFSGALGLHAPIARQPLPTHATDGTAHEPSRPTDAARRSVEASPRRGLPTSSPFAFLQRARTTDSGDD